MFEPGQFESDTHYQVPRVEVPGSMVWDFATLSEAGVRLTLSGFLLQPLNCNKRVFLGSCCLTPDKDVALSLFGFRGIPPIPMKVHVSG